MKNLITINYKGKTMRNTYFSLIILFFISVLLPHSSQDTEIIRLKTKISSLEERVQYLESLISKKSDKKLIYSQKWKNKSLWRKLRTGMSMDEVEILLGIPLNVRGGDMTTWNYDKKSSHESYVSFYMGSLDRWVEPKN